jgi:hypothetical protein
MLRRVGAIVAGLAAFAALEFAAGQAAKAIWPAYALAAPTRTYSLDILLVRLGVGALATLAVGALSAKMDRGAQQAALMFGVALLLISVVWHIRIWDQYPAWYHLGWLACIVPAAMLGGCLAGRAEGL